MLKCDLSYAHISRLLSLATFFWSSKLGLYAGIYGTWGNKEMPQTLFHYFSYLQKQIWFVWLCTISNSAFENFLTSKRDNFCKISRRIRNVMFNYWTFSLILQKIWQNHPFLKSQNFKMKSYQWYRVKQIKLIFTNKKVVKQGLGHHFIAVSSKSHFFNKTDLKQYL